MVKTPYLDAWLDLADDLCLLGAESAFVIFARMKVLARADPVALREAAIIVTEKTKLGFDTCRTLMAQAPLMRPLSSSRQNVRYLRRKVAANYRRLQDHR